MKMKLKSLFFASIAAMFLTGSAWAHHSHANYNTTATNELEGTVKELRWMNPHTWIYLEVVDQGKPSVWVLEGGSPAGVQRNGWKKEDVSPGETLKVKCNPLKDGSRGCLIEKMSSKRQTDKDY
jgi:hypothetical protein